MPKILLFIRKFPDSNVIMRTCIFFRVHLYYAGEFQITATSAAATTTTTTTTTTAATTASVPIQEMYVLQLICKLSGVWEFRRICK